MKIYWDNITDVDHAILLPTGHIIGNSYIAKGIAEGNNDNEEAVILDFSTGKKQLKQLCDNIVDHKLWVNKNYHDIIYLEDSVIVKCYQGTRTVFRTQLPKDAIFVQDFIVDEPENAFKTQARYIEIATEIANDYVGECASTPSMNVTISNNKNVFSVDNLRMYFRYTHGLPTSTSYGCQNICHGHLSYVEFIPKENTPRYLVQHTRLRSYLTDVFRNMGALINLPKALGYSPNSPRAMNLHFVAPNVRVTQYDKSDAEISYTIETTTRGEMSNTLCRFDTHKRDRYFYAIVELEKLSTIENLGEFFRKEIEEVHPELLELFDIRISEGLSKGVLL